MKKRTEIIIAIISLEIIYYIIKYNGVQNSDYIDAIFFLFLSTIFSTIYLKIIASMKKDVDKKEYYWYLFTLRIAIILALMIIITPAIAGLDFGLSIFATPVVGIIAFFQAIINSGKEGIEVTPIQNNKTIAAADLKNIYLCKYCQAEIQMGDLHCHNCGKKLTKEDYVTVDSKNFSKSEETIATQVSPAFAKATDFDSMYNLPEAQMIEAFLLREMEKAKIDKNSLLIPSAILKRKRLLNIIFSILLFVYITLIFFHFPTFTYVLGLIILIVFFILSRKYSLVKYLSKEIKARPQEKISNIVMNAKTTMVEDNTRPLFAVMLVFAALLPLLIFYNPRIIYEKADDGYGVRFYIFGLTNYKTATIPATYKGKDVVTLRGNTFSNMPYLEKVKLPDTIVEIRGQAFKNCKRLTDVNMPSKLEYLGGGAFYNAQSIKSIELPDTLSTMGGETFYGAKSLEYVKLPKYLSEIRGDSFEYCTSLQSITIPDSVTRIGGHAFYGDTALSKVEISKNSQLSEIGSSAFRLCTSLYEIHIPANTYVNERAFKESPTNVLRYGDSGYNNNYYPYNYYQ
jgi:hypothetical protein